MMKNEQALNLLLYDLTNEGAFIIEHLINTIIIRI